MKRIIAAMLLTGLAVATQSVLAVSPELELATQRGCFICHTINRVESDNLPLAPAYQEIAERYRAKKESFDKLTERVLHGTLYSGQNWEGEVSMRFMPPNVNVSRLEAAELVNWILNLPVDEALLKKLRQHEEMLILSTTSGCMACHRMEHSPDTRLMPLAPAFRDVAKRYEGDNDAVQRLVRSMKKGTRAADKSWPDVNMQFMPPNVALKGEHARQLAEWIMSLKPTR